MKMCPPLLVHMKIWMACLLEVGALLLMKSLHGTIRWLVLHASNGGLILWRMERFKVGALTAVGHGNSSALIALGASELAACRCLARPCVRKSEVIGALED